MMTNDNFKNKKPPFREPFKHCSVNDALPGFDFDAHLGNCVRLLGPPIGPSRPEMQTQDQPFALRPFQRKLVRDLLKKLSHETSASAEVFCGAGKTIIAATCAVRFLKAQKKVLFISPNRAAFESFQKDFHLVLSMVGTSKTISCGGLNEEAEIMIVTPGEFVKASSKRFHSFVSLMKQVGFVILDEVHRYPHDPTGTTVVIGKIEPLINEYIRNVGGRVLCMTATHFRSDGKAPFGCHIPDFRWTLKDLTDAGVAPVLHGIPIPIQAEISGERISQDVIHLNMARRELVHYLERVRDIVFALHRTDPEAAHCIFVSKQAQAHELVLLLNDTCGFEAFVALTSDSTNTQKRCEIVNRINDGVLKGYVTVSLGAESLNIPRLKYCHLVARIVSDVKLMQSIGRVTRCLPGKDKCVVVDYQVMKQKIQRLSRGLRHIVKLSGSTLSPEMAICGGSLMSESSPISDVHLTLGEFEKWIEGNSAPERPKIVKSEIIKRDLLLLAQSGGPKPSWNSALGTGLRAFRCQTSSSFDPEFTQRIDSIRPDWTRVNTNTLTSAKQKKQTLLKLADSGIAKPASDTVLGRALHRYTSRASESFDPDFCSRVNSFWKSLPQVSSKADAPHSRK